MLRDLALAATFIFLAPSLAPAQTAQFQIEEATIETIQSAIMRGELTSTRVVQLYLNRIRAYNGTCVRQPDGVLGAGPITPIKNARQLNALMTLNLRPAKRQTLGFDPRKARSMTDAADNDPAMPDALDVAARQDVYDPKDELTAFGIGRMPAEPYRSFANERTLNGMRIGVIREHMDKKVFNEADVQAIDLTESAIGDLRRIGATIVDPGPGGALFQACIDKYFPLYRSRVFIEQNPNLFPSDANGTPATDRVSQLVDMHDLLSHGDFGK